jgi:cobalt/nickel transport system permease protein
MPAFRFGTDHHGNTDMHLPDHFLDPATLALTAVVSGGAVTYSLARVRSEGSSKALPAAGLAAGIFAAQMVNFPVGAGTSGHLIGGTLAGMLLGPWAGLLAMSAVLAVQAIVFGDGGIFALGANILNMGVIGVALGVAVDRLFVTTRPNFTNSLMRRAFASALAGWIAVVAGALACAIEMAVSGAASAGEVVPAMLGVHAMIGLAEGAITAIVVTACCYGFAHGRLGAVERRQRVFGAALALAIVIALAPLASMLPDGLESVAAGLTSLQLEAEALVPPVFADYAIPGIAWESIATVLAGIVGVALVFAGTSLACIGIRRTN